MMKKGIDFNRLPKQAYIQPSQEIVELRYRKQLLLTGSVTGVGLEEEDKLLIDDTTPITEEFWGR